MSTPVNTLETILTFGKYRDWTVDQVLDEDPTYIRWCVEQRIFVLDEEADDALLKALDRFGRR